MFATRARAKEQGGEDRMREALWERFKGEDGDPRLRAEHFDYAAARLYATAEDPPILSSQAQRLQQWRRRNKCYLDTRQVTAYEEQTLYHGLITFPTLTKGKLGLHEIVNRKDLRLGSPEATVPLRMTSVHLCWGVGYAGYATSFKPDAQATTSVAYASVLQGLAALLFDDWRNALRLLPVRFFAHRARPRPVEVAEPKGGRRWRNRDTDPVALPPAHIVGHFFRRADAVALSQAGRWQVSRGGRGRRGWWCGCVLACDLPEFGFRESKQTVQTRGGPAVWVAEASLLPVELSHLIVVNKPRGAAHIFRVHHPVSGRGYTRLQPERRYLPRDLSDDPSFRPLRVSALDLVLDEIQTRLVEGQ